MNNIFKFAPKELVENAFFMSVLTLNNLEKQLVSKSSCKTQIY